MPLFVQTARNEAVLAELGSYRKYINLLDRRHTRIQRIARRAGIVGYEPDLQATLLGILQGAPRGHVFFDVGAHIGLYSALAYAVYGRHGLRVVAFEPCPPTFAMARRLKANNEFRYSLANLALSSRAGTRPLYISSDDDTKNSLNAKAHPRTSPLDVQATTLDEYVASNALAPTILKIDVETHEADVINGGKATLGRMRPWLLCELRKRLNRSKLKLTLNWLQSIDYVFYRLSDPLWHTHSVDEVVDDLDDRDTHWLLSPTPVLPPLIEQIQAWKDAIAACDAEAVILTEAGAPVPPELLESW